MIAGIFELPYSTARARRPIRTKNEDEPATATHEPPERCVRVLVLSSAVQGVSLATSLRLSMAYFVSLDQLLMSPWRTRLHRGGTVGQIFFRGSDSELPYSTAQARRPIHTRKEDEPATATHQPPERRVRVSLSGCQWPRLNLSLSLSLSLLHSLDTECPNA